MKEIPLLTKEDIECRIQSVNDKGAVLLLYKTARADMRILDEVFGAMNWQRHHEVVNGNLFCTISIYDADKGQWVSKQDCGVPSNTQGEKGEASDAFKRAGFSWGIGRELYDSPFICSRFAMTKAKNVIVLERKRITRRSQPMTADRKALRQSLNW